MDEWTIVILVLCSLFTISSASVLGYWLKLRYLHRHMPKMVDQLNDLRSAVDELRGEMDSQTAELHDRLDFAERILTSGINEERDTPQPTPV